MAGRTTNHTANRLAFSCSSSSSSSVVLTARFTDDAVVRRRTATLPKSSTGGAADGRFVYQTDALGSVAAITDDVQATVRTYTYEAFGKLRATTGTGPVGGNRFTYTGREPLGDSGALYYYRWRVLDPNIGRFTSEDPLGFVDGPNRFVYVKNRPLVFVDRTGEACGPGLLGDLIFPDFWFTACCKKHDDCYADCQGPSKQECDDQFISCMKAKCNTLTASSQPLCNFIAAQYHGWVVLHVTAFDAARAKCCKQNH